MNTSLNARTESNTVAALLIAPLVAAFGVAFAGQVEDGFDTFSFSALLGWTFIFYAYAGWATLLLGLPGFLLMRKLGAIRWWSTTLFGAFVGIGVFVVIDPRGMQALAADGQKSALLGCIGALAAFAFWFVRERGVNRSSPST